MVSTLIPTGVTGSTLKLDVAPAGTPVTLRVTGSLYPSIEPMSTVKVASFGWHTSTIVGEADKV